MSESLLTSSFSDNWDLAAKTPTTPKGRLAAKKASEDVWAGVKTGSVYSSEVGVAAVDPREGLRQFLPRLNKGK